MSTAPTVDRRPSDADRSDDLAFSTYYGRPRGGLNVDGRATMIHFTASAGEEPDPRPATLDPAPENDPTVAQAEAIMRALDEVLAEARRLRAGLVSPSV